MFNNITIPKSQAGQQRHLHLTDVNQHTTSLLCCQRLLVFHDGTIHSGCNTGFLKKYIPVHPIRDPPRLFDSQKNCLQKQFHSRSLLEQKKAYQICQLDQVLHMDNVVLYQLYNFLDDLQRNSKGEFKVFRVLLRSHQDSKSQ